MVALEQSQRAKFTKMLCFHWQWCDLALSQAQKNPGWCRDNGRSTSLYSRYIAGNWPNYYSLI